MNGMPGCDKVLLVQAELDDELDAAQAVALRAHREGCAICRAAEIELSQARRLVQRNELYEPVPDAVRARLVARLSAVRPATRLVSLARPPRWRLLWQPVAGFGLGAACAATLALMFLMPGQQSLLGQVITGHIRALQPGHLEDVASSDQHTVKPWFDGRLDFAPPVRDFAAQGFPLKGGRLDYLGGRPVAALVYQRNKHVINLFVWPAPSVTPKPPEVATEQGYNVVHWSGAGMSFWAASDVERAQLGDFAELWRHEP
jgi:anti-sigma factor RsiW